MAAKKKKAAPKKRGHHIKPTTANQRPPGRPRKFGVLGEGLLDRIEKLAGLGLNNEQIALCLDMAPSTLYNYFEREPELYDAVQRGKAKAIAAVVNATYQEAMRGNVAAQKFFLTNRDRENWKERQDLTHDIGKDTLSAVDAFKEALKKK